MPVDLFARIRDGHMHFRGRNRRLEALAFRPRDDIRCVRDATADIETAGGAIRDGLVSDLVGGRDLLVGRFCLAFRYLIEGPGLVRLVIGGGGTRERRRFRDDAPRDLGHDIAGNMTASPERRKRGRVLAVDLGLFFLGEPAKAG